MWPPSVINQIQFCPPCFVPYWGRAMHSRVLRWPPWGSALEFATLNGPKTVLVFFPPTMIFFSPWNLARFGLVCPWDPKWISHQIWFFPGFKTHQSKLSRIPSAFPFGLTKFSCIIPYPPPLLGILFCGDSLQGWPKKVQKLGHLLPAPSKQVESHFPNSTPFVFFWYSAFSFHIVHNTPLLSLFWEFPASHVLLVRSLWDDP